MQYKAALKAIGTAIGVVALALSVAFPVIFFIGYLFHTLEPIKFIAALFVMVVFTLIIMLSIDYYPRFKERR